MSTAARIDELRKKFDENPRRYFAPLANEYRKAGELALAIALCREHLPKQPGHMSGHIVFGQALFEQAMGEGGDLTEARTVFESALALDPENLIALRHLGDIAKAMGDAPAARRWYERVLDADPRNDDIAAQLATLSTGLTPPSVPAVSMPTPAAGTPGVPGFAMPPLPTPDAAMRAVDFDAVNRQIARFTPLDLDAMDAPDAAPASDPAPALEVESTAMSDADSSPATADVVHGEAAESAAMGPEVVERDSVGRDADVGLPSDAIDAGEQRVQSAFDMLDTPDEAIDAIDDAALHTEPTSLADDAATLDESFEEGLIAPDWPDTTPFVTRLQTPRAGTPAMVPAVNEGGRADAREDDLAFAAAASGPEDAADAFGRELHERSTHAPEAEPPVSLDGDAADVRPEAPTMQGTPESPEEHASSGATDAAVDELQPVEAAHSTDMLDEAFDEPSHDRGASHESSSESPDVAVVHELPDVTDETTGDVPTAEHVMESAAPQVSEQAADDVAEHATHHDTAHDEAEELPYEVEASFASAGRPVSAEFDAIADAFAADARDVGESDEVVMSEYEPAGSNESAFADVHPDLDDADESELSDAAVGSMPAPPAFVTETMGELLVSQGFVDRAVGVYEELVRRRPYDPVLSSRLDELRARLAESTPVEPTAARMPTPASVTPASVTPALGTPALGTPALGTPALGTPAFSPNVATPHRAATPWSTPALEQSAASVPTARELFAGLASRRVPRRTPPQSAPAVHGGAAGESSEANLSALFGNVPSESHDDSAARALADAFAPLSAQELSGQALDSDFARAFLSPESAPSAPFSSATPRPSSVSTTTSTPTPRGGAFSFDRFFPDPATPASPTEPGATNASSSGPTPAPAGGTESPAQDSRAGAAPVDDLAEFSAWLKGLGKS